MYPELGQQMKAAKISYLNNKWSDIFDFTPNRVGTSLNHSISTDCQKGFVTSLSQMQKLIASVENHKGTQITSLKRKDQIHYVYSMLIEIGEEDLEEIMLDFGDSPQEEDYLIPFTVGQKKYTEVSEVSVSKYEFRNASWSSFFTVVINYTKKRQLDSSVNYSVLSLIQRLTGSKSAGAHIWHLTKSLSLPSQCPSNFTLESTNVSRLIILRLTVLARHDYWHASLSKLEDLWLHQSTRNQNEVSAH